MALLKCKECGKEVSNKADSCPNCGVRIKREPMGCGTFIGVVFFGAIAIGAFQSASDDRPAVSQSTNTQKIEREPEPEVTRPIQQNIGLRWRYIINKDKMSDGNVYFATLKSNNTFEFSFPYTGRQRATLMLRTHPRHGKDVILTVEKGQFKCRYRGCNVLIRFGSGNAVNYEAVKPSDNSSDTLFIRNYHAFVENMMRVDTVRISPEFYKEGNPTLEFKVQGFDVGSYLPSKKASTSTVETPPTTPKGKKATNSIQAKAEIQKRIINHWRMPAELDGSQSAELEVFFIDGEDVGEVKVIKSSGERSFDMSLIAAVYDAAPYELPDSNTKSLVMRFVNKQEE